MKIYCNRCNKYLGNIKTGSSLRKGIVYLCTECNQAARIAESVMKDKIKTDQGAGFDIFDFFNNITKGKEK